MTPEDFTRWLEQKIKSPTNDLFTKPLIMGVLNATTDSFFDGGKYSSSDKACEHALKLLEDGADIIDIGGESSRPGAAEIPLDVELSRVLPVIKAIRKKSNICLSIDTYKPEVMEAAIDAGANMINDIYALRKSGSLAVAAKLAVPVCLMHMQNNPINMQDSPNYPNGVLKEVENFFVERIRACKEVGIEEKNIVLDFGFGFGKSVEDNLHLVYKFKSLRRFGYPLLLGASRKSTIGTVLNKKVDQRLIGSLAIGIYAALQGVSILRTHDVDETKQALHMIDAIHRANVG